MALATLSLASVLSATGWTGATTTNLNTSDNARATGGTVNEAILADLASVPADWQAVSGDIVLKAEALTSGNATRAKRLRLELLDANDQVLGTGETSNLSTTESTVSVTVTGRTDDQTAANGWRIRATVLESGGKGDSVSVAIDRLWVEATYGNALPARTGDALIPLGLALSGTGGVEVRGSAGIDLGLGLASSGGVLVGGSGALPLALALAGAGTIAAEQELEERTGEALIGLGLGWSGAGRVTVTGAGEVRLALALVGAGVADDEVEQEPPDSSPSPTTPIRYCGQPVRAWAVDVEVVGSHPLSA
jgi:hypothetical protein